MEAIAVSGSSRMERYRSYWQGCSLAEIAEGYLGGVCRRSPAGLRRTWPQAFFIRELGRLFVTISDFRIVPGTEGQWRRSTPDTLIDADER